MTKVKLLFLCSGLGNINRGYESFTRECYDNLKLDNRIDAFLFKGGGNSKNKEFKIFNFPRNGAGATKISKILKKDSYTIEQFTFFVSLIPKLISINADVILVSDFLLSTYLWHLRKFLKLKFKILFSNGAPNGPPFNQCDHIHQLLPIHFEIALQGGISRSIQSVIPYGIYVSPIVVENKSAIKLKLNIPVNTKVILSVAAINSYHKRMDYLINEFSKLNNSNLFLILLGQTEQQSEEIIELAKLKLPKKNYIIRSVSHDEVNDFYKIADLFALASLREGLPRVIIEAMSNGLPVLIHDYQIAHEILGNYGYYGDFTKEGVLTNLIRETLNTTSNTSVLMKERNNYIYNNFSWDILKEQYIKMVIKLAGK